MFESVRLAEKSRKQTCRTDSCSHPSRLTDKENTKQTSRADSYSPLISVTFCSPHQKKTRKKKRRTDSYSPLISVPFCSLRRQNPGNKRAGLIHTVIRHILFTSPKKPGNRRAGLIRTVIRHILFALQKKSGKQTSRTDSYSPLRSVTFCPPRRQNLGNKRAGLIRTVHEYPSLYLGIPPGFSIPCPVAD
jgi:hypothetical protein